ncbi:inorganic pyrophosphatase [Mucor mucedo]|uniref:inorganic pyrophosphatase n=1 Tax=Mucor mucedo TaxID=29922 RepID=UPI00221F5FE2|nr:inorganic pyrophosphatase [Mucor mucedo]KAI7889879.1 inorganic pyrophosphatase [Mucor mucedo]
MNTMLTGHKALRKSFVRYSSYKSIVVGKPFTPSHRVYIAEKDKVISPFHDIPLYVKDADKSIVNMVVEIPRWSNAKVEIATGEKFNPLKQDIKKGKPRFVRNCFPYKGYIWNYGALPQTWEDPNHIHPETMAKGDNDPIDVIEIGQEIAQQGQVKQVKVLGIMAMLDEGETDWKVLAIDTKDPMAHQLNDVKDVETLYPGLIDATRNWFKIYKIPDGKPENEFAFNGACKDREYANTIVAETHHAWKNLMDGKVDKHSIDLNNTTQTSHRVASENIVSDGDISSTKEEDAKGYDPKWYFV